MEEQIRQAAEWIRQSKHVTVFTGAGISVESGIPPFRGTDGLWSRYDPNCLDIGYFKSHPLKAWEVIKEIFYDFFGKAVPNDAHKQVAELEKMGYVKAVITQNIDSLHQEAGSTNVYEFHGTSRTLSCTGCKKLYPARKIPMESLPPRCPACSGVLKPDFVFFGEAIPQQVNFMSFYEAQVADLFLVIGTTGEVMPACMVPVHAKENGAKIIEINTELSSFTNSITDIFLQGKASEMMNRLLFHVKASDKADK